MAVAMFLFLGAMTEQRHSLAFRQVLEQSQRELLSVVFDSFVVSVYSAGFAQFLQITAAVFTPGDPAGQDRVAKFFARPEVRHPDIEPIRGEPPATPPSGEDPKAIFPFYRAVN
jgi:hypothetical protein